MSDAALGLRAWKRRGLRVVKPVLSGVEGVCRKSPIVDLTLLASISSWLSFVCVAVSETLKELHYERHGLSAPVRKRTRRADDVPCVPYAAASRANRSCIFYRQNHRLNPRRSSDQSALGSAA